jgi:hypothetical protein
MTGTYDNKDLIVRKALKHAVQIVLIIFIASYAICISSYASAESLKPLPDMPIFPENPLTPEKVELGKKLFFDRLERNCSLTGGFPATGQWPVQHAITLKQDIPTRCQFRSAIRQQRTGAMHPQ